MGPALAALVSGDRSSFHDCSFISVQDTLSDLAGRHYYENCYIEGSVDFIFGNAQSIFQVQNCICPQYMCVSWFVDEESEFVHKIIGVRGFDGEVIGATGVHHGAGTRKRGKGHGLRVQVVQGGRRHAGVPRARMVCLRQGHLLPNRHVQHHSQPGLGCLELRWQ